ncbi:MAG: hypothetical protein WCI67_16120 [Chloroflexales bacterium]
MPTTTIAPVAVHITEESPIFGPATATEEQVSQCILSRPTGAYTDHDVAGVIVPTYFLYCENLRVNPVIPIAQMLYETANLTSWWAARPRRNPAGIGVSGARQAAAPAGGGAWAYSQDTRFWLAGVSFDSWEHDAIPAHVGRLLAWCLRPAERSAMQGALIARALSYRPLAARHHGSARSLKMLGKRHNLSGEGWASPGTTYGRSIAALALQLSRGR